MSGIWLHYIPTGKTVVGSKWVYKMKTGEDRTVEQYKARLVAQGYTQKYRSDYDETFRPVVQQESLRVLLALSVQYGLKLHQVNMTTAFHNGNLEEEVYMAQPEGFASEGNEHLVCRLKKSIYGLKQSPSYWNTALDLHLKRIGFTQSNNDPCIYYKEEDGNLVYMGVYVDDIVLIAKTNEQLQDVKTCLEEQVDIKDMGKLCKYGMQDCKLVSTPAESGTKLKSASGTDECVDQRLYQSAVGSLMYLSVTTQPEVTDIVSNLARFSVKPTKDHWNAAK